jgi:transcriptional regulator with XRE-family HTH domain
MNAEDVDEIAVERACKGDRSVTLNRAEAAAAIAACARRGLSDNETAELLGITSRTVLRVRHGETALPFTRPGATVDNTRQRIAVALKHQHAPIRRAAQKANDALAALDTLLADWDAKELARERVAELERELAEARAALRGPAGKAKSAPRSGEHAQARAWATANGVSVPQKGRVPDAVMEQWKQASA